MFDRKTIFKAILWGSLLLCSPSCLLLARAQEDSACQVTYPFDPLRYKQVYTVGVLAIRGKENAFAEFNSTFADYLTATAGQRFTQTIEFRMKALNFIELFDDTGSQQVDFIYVNPSAYSCIESEYTAFSLVSQTSRRNVAGQTYRLKQFGGVIAARADNDEIQTIHDLKGKIIAAASISGLGSGQMQFLEMIENGMSYINDPKQLVFTSNQGKVVNGVLDREFDVGFIRTDQIERTLDADGNPVDKSLLKIIDVKENLTIDGEPFPFLSSTPLYPEWNVAALSHVPPAISRQVTEALLALQEHALVGLVLQDCDAENNSTFCDSILQFSNETFTPRCEVSREIAQTALRASNDSRVVGWQTTLSYMQLRSMQEATGFIRRSPPESQNWLCVRSAEIYEAITCPEGYIIKSEEEVSTGCNALGLNCRDGYQCLCSPCQLIDTCDDGIDWNGRCISMIPLVMAPLAFVCILVCIAFCIAEGRKRESDAVWLVNPEELIYGDPIRILGRGSFGMVLMADYRGTNVAVKRVLPSRTSARAKADSFRFTDEELGSRRSSFIESNPGLMTLNHGTFRHGIKMGSFSLASSQVSYAAMRKDFVREMRQISKLRHPCITTVMGAVLSSKDDAMLVMEYMGRGSMYDVMRNPEEIEEYDERVVSILKDVAQGLRFLHSAKPQILHGDLKSKNVLIDDNFRAKVADFGLSAKSKSNRSRAGTPFWMAPELFDKDSVSSAASDVYAFGILIYEAFTKSNPYEGEDVDVVLRGVCDPVQRKRPPHPENCSSKIIELYCDALQHDPSLRPSTEYIDQTLKVEDRVRERTNKLEALNRELAAANEKIAKASAQKILHFASMSHEIRTPLNCILGLSSVFDSNNLSPDQRESLDMIAKSGHLLCSIVDDVLDYSKLELDKAEIDKRKVSLQDMVHETVSSMVSSSLAVDNNIRIRTHIDSFVDEFVETDGRRLVQILYNLLSNAVKFSHRGGEVIFSVRLLENGFMSSNDRAQDEEAKKYTLQFEVTDYGKGIEKSELSHIFEPFSQANGGVNQVEGGTGLGLAIVTKLTDALGGTVDVQSQKNKFSTFTVTFPDFASQVNPSILASPLSTTTVLHLGTDDDGKVLARVFDSYGIPFKTACRPENFDNARSEAKDSNSLLLIRDDMLESSVIEGLANKHTKLVVYGKKSISNIPFIHASAIDRLLPSILISSLANICRTNGQNSLQDQYSSLSTDPTSVIDIPSLRVLVAEDNAVNQKVLRRLLQRLEIKDIVVVENGLLAVEMEASREFDVIIMDMQMPVMNGDEACMKILAREGGHTHPRIVMASAHVSEDFRKKFEAAGATGYLPKPFSVQALKQELLKTLSQ